MKIDLKQPLTNLKGEAIKDGSEIILLNVLLANAIVSATDIKAIKPIRGLEISLELNKTGVMDLTTAEREAIKEFIENNKTFTYLTKGQMQKLIEDFENKK